MRVKRLLCCLLTASMITGLFCGCVQAPPAETPGASGTDPSVPNEEAGNSPMPYTKVEQLLTKVKPDDPDYYRQLAALAVADVVDNWYDRENHRILPTWSGYHTDQMEDPRGSIWETAMLLFGIYDMYVVTGDSTYKDLVLEEAKFFRENFEPEELENAGGLFNWANDDCSWNAMMLLCFYTMTEDTWFLDRAINLLDNVVDRWYDPELNGLYYRDDVDFMSMYEVGIALSWLRIWEITGEQRFYDLALRSYQGMQDRLAMDNGLYYCEANIHYPVGGQKDISEAGSSSFLAGNMGMAALSAKLYKITGEQVYLDRVYKTNEGLLAHYNDGGVLLNDRDAWTNGTFAAVYASEVLSLPDTQPMRDLLLATADSIVRNCRTPDGYYGGTWKGPAEGAKSVWYSKGSVPQQSKTTGSTVMMVTAAAIVEAGINDYVR